MEKLELLQLQNDLKSLGVDCNLDEAEGFWGCYCCDVLYVSWVNYSGLSGGYDWEYVRQYFGVENEPILNRVEERTFDFNSLPIADRLNYCEDCLERKNSDLKFDIYFADTGKCSCCELIKEVCNPSFLEWAKTNFIDRETWLGMGKQRIYSEKIIS